MRRKGAASDGDRDVFLNVPFDSTYEPMYVALITGLCALGLTPRSVVETPPGTDRLRRLVSLIRSCACSIHDLSQVGLSDGPTRVPRFNMPFELGVAVAIAQARPSHHWFMFEAERFRLQKSLSDVNGYDPFIHDGKPDGVLKAIKGMFHWPEPRPNIKDLRALLLDVKLLVRTLKREHALGSFFDKTGFGLLVLGVQKLVSGKHRPLWR